MFKCAKCCSAVVGELKKGKYIYYHCADKTKACPNKGVYIKQEEIDSVFERGIKGIALTPEHKAAVITALKESYADMSEYITS